MSFNFARYSQWFRWFRVHTISINPWVIKASEIPSKDDAKFLGTVAKGILNRSPRTTLITNKQTFLRRNCRCRKNLPDIWRNTTQSKTQLHQRKNGFTSSVTFRTANRNHISRPIEKLYPIEVSGDGVELQDSQQKKNEEENIPRTRRPARAAAQEASKGIKAHSEHLMSQILDWYSIPRNCNCSYFTLHFVAGPGECHEHLYARQSLMLCHNY